MQHSSVELLPAFGARLGRLLDRHAVLDLYRDSGPDPQIQGGVIYHSRSRIADRPQLQGDAFAHTF